MLCPDTESCTPSASITRDWRSLVQFSPLWIHRCHEHPISTILLRAISPNHDTSSQTWASSSDVGENNRIYIYIYVCVHTPQCFETCFDMSKQMWLMISFFLTSRRKFPGWFNWPVHPCAKRLRARASGTQAGERQRPRKGNNLEHGAMEELARPSTTNEPPTQAFSRPRHQCWRSIMQSSERVPLPMGDLSTRRACRHPRSCKNTCPQRKVPKERLKIPPGSTGDDTTHDLGKKGRFSRVVGRQKHQKSKTRPLYMFPPPFGAVL